MENSNTAGEQAGRIGTRIVFKDLTEQHLLIRKEVFIHPHPHTHKRLKTLPSDQKKRSEKSVVKKPAKFE